MLILAHIFFSPPLFSKHFILLDFASTAVIKNDRSIEMQNSDGVHYMIRTGKRTLSEVAASGTSSNEVLKGRSRFGG